MLKRYGILSLLWIVHCAGVHAAPAVSNVTVHVNRGEWVLIGQDLGTNLLHELNQGVQVSRFLFRISETNDADCNLIISHKGFLTQGTATFLECEFKVIKATNTVQWERTYYVQTPDVLQISGGKYEKVPVNVEKLPPSISVGRTNEKNDFHIMTIPYVTVNGETNSLIVAIADSHAKMTNNVKVPFGMSGCDPLNAKEFSVIEASTTAQ